MMKQEQIAHKSPSKLSRAGNELKKLLIFLICLVLISGAGAGGYFYGKHMSSNPLEGELANSPAINENTQSSNFILSEGYPLNTNKKVVIKLSLPNTVQGVAINSSNQDPGLTPQISGGVYNEEMGRWIIANPSLTRQNSRLGDLSVLHIGNDWLNSNTGGSGYQEGVNSVDGYEFSTPGKKVESLAKLETDSKSCEGKGLEGLIISNNFYVCTSIEHQREATETYTPIMKVKGYGEIDGEKYVMFGSFDLISRPVQGEVANKLASDFTAGNIPSETQDAARSYVDALKRSSIISTEVSR